MYTFQSLYNSTMEVNGKPIATNLLTGFRSGELFVTSKKPETITYKVTGRVVAAYKNTEIGSTISIEEYKALVYVDREGRETVDLTIEFKSNTGFSDSEKARRVKEISLEINHKVNVRMDVREVPYLTLPRFEFKTRRWTDERRAGRDFIRYQSH